MKAASFDALKDKIIRPDFDKHLIPLMLYRGQRSLGHMSRLWNFAITMMECEVETYGEAVKLSHNPDFAHLCGPRRPLQHCTFPSLFGRLIENPNVTNNITGLTEYVRAVRGSKYHLTPVSIYTNDPYRKDGRYAPWRIHDFSPEVKEERERAAEEKLHCKIEKARAIHAARLERLQLRASTHAERMAWFERKKTQRIIQRAARRHDRETERAAAQEAREGKRKILLASRLADKASRRVRPLLFYPYLAHKPQDGDDEALLVMEVNDAVPKNLPEEIRSDICQDLIVAILSGDIHRDELYGSVREFTRKVQKMHPMKYGDISLDAMVSADNESGRHDLIVPPGYGRMEW